MNGLRAKTSPSCAKTDADDENRRGGRFTLSGIKFDKVPDRLTNSNFRNVSFGTFTGIWTPAAAVRALDANH